MTREEMIAMAQAIRERDHFGPVSPEELAALPGTETELHIPVEGGRTVHVYEERPDHLPEKTALILNYHGGGFLKGRTDRDRRYCCTIMEQLNALVWDVDYCIAPEEPFPAAVEECYGIAAYAFDHADELGIDPDKIILAGHSAGGNLVAAACLKKAEAEVKQAGAFTVQNWLEAELRAVNAPLYNRCKYKIRQTKPKKCR